MKNNNNVKKGLSIAIVGMMVLMFFVAMPSNNVESKYTPTRSGDIETIKFNFATKTSHLSNFDSYLEDWESGTDGWTTDTTPNGTIYQSGAYSLKLNRSYAEWFKSSWELVSPNQTISFGLYPHETIGDNITILRLLSALSIDEYRYAIMDIIWNGTHIIANGSAYSKSCAISIAISSNTWHDITIVTNPNVVNISVDSTYSTCSFDANYYNLVSFAPLIPDEVKDDDGDSEGTIEPKDVWIKDWWLNVTDVGRVKNAYIKAHLYVTGNPASLDDTLEIGVNGHYIGWDITDITTNGWHTCPINIATHLVEGNNTVLVTRQTSWDSSNQLRLITCIDAASYLHSSPNNASWTEYIRGLNLRFELEYWQTGTYYIDNVDITQDRYTIESKYLTDYIKEDVIQYEADRKGDLNQIMVYPITRKKSDAENSSLINASNDDHIIPIVALAYYNPSFLPTAESVAQAYHDNTNGVTGLYGEWYYANTVPIKGYLYLYGMTGNSKYKEWAKSLSTALWNTRDGTTNIIPDQVNKTTGAIILNYERVETPGDILSTFLLGYELTDDVDYLNWGKDIADAQIQYRWDGEGWMYKLYLNGDVWSNCREFLAYGLDTAFYMLTEYTNSAIYKTYAYDNFKNVFYSGYPIFNGLLQHGVHTTLEPRKPHPQVIITSIGLPILSATLSRNDNFISLIQKETARAFFFGKNETEGYCTYNSTDLCFLLDVPDGAIYNAATSLLHSLIKTNLSIDYGFNSSYGNTAYGSFFLNLDGIGYSSDRTVYIRTKENIASVQQDDGNYYIYIDDDNKLNVHDDRTDKIFTIRTGSWGGSMPRLSYVSPLAETIDAEYNTNSGEAFVNLSASGNANAIMNFNDDLLKFDIQHGSTYDFNLTVSAFNISENSTLISFAANTTNGVDVKFTITGLTPDRKYTIKRDGIVFEMIDADASGDLIFDNSEWSNHTFTITDYTAIDLVYSYMPMILMIVMIVVVIGAVTKFGR